VRGRPCVGQARKARRRRALDLARRRAIQHHPVIKAFSSRLRAAGPPHRLARCAAGRTLVRIAWAVASTKQDFAPPAAARQRSAVAAG
jgi:hypothetical protein